MTTHTGEKPLQSDHYKMAFLSNDGLSKHMTTHTGKKSTSAMYTEILFQKVKIILNMKRYTLKKIYISATSVR